MKRTDKKMAELILYIALQSEDDERFGATKLNKILFYSDFFRYGEWGKSITDQSYQRLDNGPAPKRLLPIRKKLIEQEELAIQTVERFGREQQRPIALREPDLSDFTADEIKLVDEIIEELWERNATDVSNLSHRFLGTGWKCVQEKEIIPYETVFLSHRSLTPAERAHAKELTEDAA